MLEMDFHDSSFFRCNRPVNCRRLAKSSTSRPCEFIAVSGFEHVNLTAKIEKDCFCCVPAGRSGNEAKQQIFLGGEVPMP